MTANLTIMLNSPWEICFDLPPVQYTQWTKICKTDPSCRAVGAHLCIFIIMSGNNLVEQKYSQVDKNKEFPSEDMEGSWQRVDHAFILENNIKMKYRMLDR